MQPSLLYGALAALILWIGSPGHAWADTVETALMPGQVIEGHAKWEDDCTKCHKRFDKAAQSTLCLDCHKDVRTDVERQKGFHGRFKDQRPCKECHTEHKGRTENIAPISDRTFDHEHTAWSAELARFVADGRVDYARWGNQGRPGLTAYLATVASVGPDDYAAMTREQRLAFWINAYNAYMVKQVLDHYPLESVRSIGLLPFAAFKDSFIPMERLRGSKLSLDDIEHTILRGLFKDPRVHYAVNCASIGCPNLRTEAFTGTKLDAQLDAAARAYVNHSRGLSIGPNGVIVSSIYRWFKADFGGEDTGVLAHLHKYAGPALAQKLETIRSIDGYSYDWGLNDLRH